MNKSLLIIVVNLILISTGFFAQNSDGYWDDIRKTEKRISLPDHERTWIKVDLPVGTTQFVYRISFIDVNANLRSSLASVIRGIPDGTGTAQATSAALNLLNSIGGNNKGDYYIFMNARDANYFYNYGESQNECFKNTNDITEDKNVFYLNNNSCFNESTRSLWFAFYNSNLTDDFDVVLEVLPWIDKEKENSWLPEDKKILHDKCLESYSSFNLINPDLVCVCINNKLESKYKLEDLPKMPQAELNAIINEFFNLCIYETNEFSDQMDLLRDQAHEAASNNDFGTAISNILTLVDEEVALSEDYNSLGWYYILTKQYLKAIKFLSEGEKLDNTDLMIQGNLAHANLLSGNFEAASQIYQKFKGQNIDEEMSWEQMVVSDFEEFKKRGINSEKFEEILSIIKE
jgi:hypothetical protein